MLKKRETKLDNDEIMQQQIEQEKYQKEYQ